MESSRPEFSGQRELPVGVAPGGDQTGG
jgi:hypothetical protein